MKKFLIFVAVFVLFSIAAFSQDSASVEVIKHGISVAETKFPFVTKLMALVAIISEALSLIPSEYVKANGILDAIVKWIKALTK